MKLIKPSVEYWQAPEDWRDQVARAARLCYASESGKKTSEEFVDMLIKRNHISMLRHGTRYFVINVNDKNPIVPGWIFVAMTNNPYVGCVYHKCKANKHNRAYFVAANCQYLMEHEAITNHLNAYEVSLGEFVAQASALNFPTAFTLIRYTVCVTTQISTSRELNRTSPNNIAEQSTRYVNFGKKGGVTIVIPHWWECAHWSKRLLARIVWKVDEWAYNIALRLGLPTQDARGFLPLDAGTRVAYTYSVHEWKNIMRLRLTGETGKPHPNAHIAAQQIHDAILPAMKVFGGPDSSLI